MSKIVLICKEGFKRDCWNKIEAYSRLEDPNDGYENNLNVSQEVAEAYNIAIREVYADKPEMLDVLVVIAVDGQSFSVPNGDEGPYMDDFADFVQTDAMPNDEIWYQDGNNKTITH